MAATLTVKPGKPKTSGGGRDPIDFRSFGGGDGGGDGEGAPDYAERLRRYRLALAFGCVAIVFLFFSVSSTFLMRQGILLWDPVSSAYVRESQPIPLPLRLLGINTVLLVLASISMEMARRQAAQQVLLAPVLSIPGISSGSGRAVPWLAISAILGLGFLAGQVRAWQVIAALGFEPATAPNSSFFYILTGTHALHLAGGLLALLYAAATTTLLRKTPESRRIVVDVTAWYWHVMAALWLYILTILILAR